MRLQGLSKRDCRVCVCVRYCRVIQRHLPGVSVASDSIYSALNGEETTKLNFSSRTCSRGLITTGDQRQGPLPPPPCIEGMAGRQTQGGRVCVCGRDKERE